MQIESNALPVIWAEINCFAQALSYLNMNKVGQNLTSFELFDKVYKNLDKDAFLDVLSGKHKISSASSNSAISQQNLNK